MRRALLLVVGAALGSVAYLGVAATAGATERAEFQPAHVSSTDASLKLGVLAQPQLELARNTSSAVRGGTYNVYLRRIRLLFGGTLFGNVEYCLDTDSPNLFKASSDGVKSASLGLQDAFVTLEAYQTYFKLDAGYLLPPLAHNAVQGAGTFYGLDGFANSFRHANAFASSGDGGRDTGLQARGLLSSGRLEYRLGGFQGLRRPGTSVAAPGGNLFRIAGRLQLNLLEAETSFFYAGSYLGKKRVLSFGASYDFQGSYRHGSLDSFLDLPLGPGVFTAQVDVARWNGGKLLEHGVLPAQSALMAEAGYLFHRVKLSPFFRFEYRSVDAEKATTPDEARYGVGLTYWPDGHHLNFKSLYTRVVANPGGARVTQFDLQWQVYFF